jgi:hypothetical protein
LRWLPSVLSPSILPTASGVEELAAWLRARLGVHPQVPTLRHLARQLSHRLNMPEDVTRLAESIASIGTPNRQPQSKPAAAARKQLAAVQAAETTHAESAPAEDATQRRGPRLNSDLRGEAAAALLVACKLFFDLDAPALDTGAQEGSVSQELPPVQASLQEAAGSSSAGPSGGLSPGSDALWRQVQPSLARAAFGCPRIADALLESAPSWLKAQMMSATSPPCMPTPSAHRPSAPASGVVPWTALELLVLPPAYRCAHAHFCSTSLMPDPGRIGLYDEQREILREFEALSGSALGVYAGSAAAGRPALPQPPVTSGGEPPLPPTDSRTPHLLLGDAESIAAKYVRCDSLPAIYSARYGLLVRALAVESHLPAAWLERTTRTLEKKLLPLPAPPFRERSRKRPWDTEQLMACMDGCNGQRK